MLTGSQSETADTKCHIIYVAITVYALPYRGTSGAKQAEQGDSAGLWTDGQTGLQTRVSAFPVRQGA